MPQPRGTRSSRLPRGPDTTRVPVAVGWHLTALRFTRRLSAREAQHCAQPVLAFSCDRRCGAFELEKQLRRRRMVLPPHGAAATLHLAGCACRTALAHAPAWPPATSWQLSVVLQSTRTSPSSRSCRRAGGGTGRRGRGVPPFGRPRLDARLEIVLGFTTNKKQLLLASWGLWGNFARPWEDNPRQGGLLAPSKRPWEYRQ